MQPSISLEGPIFNVKNQNYYQNNWREQNCYDYPIKSQRFFRTKCIWLEMLHFDCIQFFFGLVHFFGLLHGEQNENQFQYQQPASLQLMLAIEIRNILLRYPLDHVGIKFSLVPNMQKWEWVLNFCLLFCGFFPKRVSNIIRRMVLNLFVQFIHKIGPFANDFTFSNHIYFLFAISIIFEGCRFIAQYKRWDWIENRQIFFQFIEF